MESINAQEATRFLELLGKDPKLTWLRYLKQWRKPPGTGDDRRYPELVPDANAYFITGNSGDPANGKTIKDSDIKSCPALFVEWDDAPLDWQINAWKDLGLPEPSIQISTGGKSIHCYWVLQVPMAPARWKVLIQRLINHCGADPLNKNPSRLMRLPGSIYYDKKTGEATANTAEIIHSSERRYSAAEIEACLPPASIKPGIKPPSGQWEPRSINEIKAAAEYIPDRNGGEGTYEQDRNALCGCAAAFSEAGIADADGAALDLLGSLWPTTDEARQVLDSTTTRNAGSYWNIAKENGYQLSRKPSKAITAAGGDYIKPLRKNIGKLADEIELGWEEDTDGPVKRTILKSGDLVELLEKSVVDNLRFNELTLYAEYKNKAITSSELDYFYIQLSERGYTIPKKDAADSLIYQAKKQSFHPVRDYLNRITNNSHIVPADISKLASKYLNSTNPLHDTMLRKTLIGAVARVMEPGCKFDTCLVLVGSTGIGKSTFLKTLASPAWFCDTAQDQDKDLKMVIHSTWFYELAELETITGKKEAGQIKALLSGSTDKFRAPYSSAMEDHDRKSIFVATCNRRDFLRDETGSRRYWVIPIPNAMHQKIDISELLENRDAIWKAAVIAYANGEKPFLDIQDELKSEQENKAYELEDIWLAPLDKWLRGFRATPEFTTEQALVRSHLRQLDHLSIDDQRRAANVLRQLGCVQDAHQTRVQGKRARLWRVGSDVSDEVVGSETGETLCAGTDLGDLSQISDKKAKSNSFLSTEGAPAAAHPHERDHTEKSAKDLSIRDKTLESAALQPPSAV